MLFDRRSSAMVSTDSNSWLSMSRRRLQQCRGRSRFVDADGYFYDDDNDSGCHDDDDYDESDFEFQPPRKRERLNHLSPDEKMYRRKLKNRIAAQTARDRKKILMEDLEERVKRLEAENEYLRSQNNKLTTVTTELCGENDRLKCELTSCVVENEQQQQGFKEEIKVESDNLMTPETMDNCMVTEQVVVATSNSGANESVPVAFGSAEFINDLQQQGQVTGADQLTPLSKVVVATTTTTNPLTLFLTIVMAMNSYSIGCEVFSSKSFKAICVRQQENYKHLDSTQIVDKIRQEITRLSISSQGKQLLSNKLEELLRSRKITKLKMG